MNETVKLAHKLVDESSQVSIALTRQMMWTLSSSSSPYDAHEIDSQVIQSRGSSDDAIEGVMSFLEKEKQNSLIKYLQICLLFFLGLRISSTKNKIA